MAFRGIVNYASDLEVRGHSENIAPPGRALRQLSVPPLPHRLFSTILESPSYPSPYQHQWETPRRYEGTEIAAAKANGRSQPVCGREEPVANKYGENARGYCERLFDYGIPVPKKIRQFWPLAFSLGRAPSDEMLPSG
jgi:hypothetical protein